MGGFPAGSINESIPCLVAWKGGSEEVWEEPAAACTNTDSTQHPTTACADGLGTKPGTVLFTTPAQPTISGATQWDLSSDAIDCTRLKVSALCLGKLSPDPNNRKQHLSLNVSKFT